MAENYDLTTLSGRLKHVMSLRHLTKKQIANFTQVSEAAVGKWFNGESKSIRSQYLNRLAEILEVSSRWLADGEGAMENKSVLAVDDPENLSEKIVAIPEYSIEFGAGERTEPSFEELTEEHPLFYDRQWFIDRRVNPENCRAFRVRGDSMEPVLFDEDRITVDCSVTRIQSGSIYAFTYNQTYRVKRLQQRLTGEIVIKSENPDYDTEIIPVDQLEYFHLVGKVIDRRGDGCL